MDEIRVGSVVWFFDVNRRVYDEGRRLVYREHFREVPIIGETPRSWILGPGLAVAKLAKKCGLETHNLMGGDYAVAQRGGNRYRVFLSRAQVDRDIFVHDNRQTIVTALGDCTNVVALRQVAVILGIQVVEPSQEGNP